MIVGLSKHVDFVGKKTLNFLFELNIDIFGSDPGACLTTTKLCHKFDAVADSGGGMEDDAFWFVCLAQLGSTFARSTLTLQMLTKVFQELLLV